MGGTQYSNAMKQFFSSISIERSYRSFEGKSPETSHRFPVSVRTFLPALGE